jgi:hypothetical protein
MIDFAQVRKDYDKFALLSDIQKAIDQDIIDIDDIEKSRKGVYSDNATNRRLKRVGKSFGSAGEQEPQKGKTPSKQDEKGQKQDNKNIDEHAKQASGSSLENAAKEATEEEVRIAAQKELQRREQEEKPQPEEEAESGTKEDGKKENKEVEKKHNTTEKETK